MKVKVISLLQPWASLVAAGHKKIETRSWNTKYRGEIYIHSSAGKQYQKLPTDCPMWMNYPQGKMGSIGSLPFGAIIGKANLNGVFCIDNEMGKPDTVMHENKRYELTEQELAFGDYSPGRYGWLLSDPVLFETPIPAKGQLGIWEFDMPENWPA